MVLDVRQAWRNWGRPSQRLPGLVRERSASLQQWAGEQKRQWPATAHADEEPHAGDSGYPPFLGQQEPRAPGDQRDPNAEQHRRHHERRQAIDGVARRQPDQRADSRRDGTGDEGEIDPRSGRTQSVVESDRCGDVEQSGDTGARVRSSVMFLFSEFCCAVAASAPRRASRWRSATRCWAMIW